VSSSGTTTFRPRAHLIHLLGEELISDEAMAVSELVKNAYDADAASVSIRFVGVDDPATGEIEIRDDGRGMSLQMLHEGWLEPATAFKRRDGRKQRTRLGRYPLGEKGVGRFAVDKLGSQLELVTRAVEASEEVRLSVSWDDYSKGGYLDEVENAWEVRDPETFVGSDQHGTSLTIRSLRTAWGNELVGRVHEALVRLISPKAEGTGFEVIFDCAQYPLFEGPVHNRLLEQAPYRLAGRVDATGYMDPVDGGDIVDLREHAGEYFRQAGGRRLRTPECGPFSVSFSVWDLDVLGDQRLPRTLRPVLRRICGVSIFRDGFRVSPYGDRDNDWLELNQRRVNNPTMRVSTNQVVGTIEITQDGNPDLRDRTSREGLIETRAFSDMRALTIAALSLLEQSRYAARKANGRSKPNPETDAVLLELERARTGGVRVGAIAAATAAYRQFRQATEQRERILLRLAGAGAASECLLAQLNGSVAGLSRLLPLVRRRASDLPQLERLEYQLSLVSHQLDSLERLRTGRLAEAVAIDLRSLAQDALLVYQPLIATTGVEVTISGATRAAVRADRSALLQALLHVLENAIVAASAMTRHRWVDIAIDEQPPALLVSDSGPGVLEQHRPHVFDPYFTTREGHDGMGLHFARDLMRAGGHDLQLGPDGTGFRFEFAGNARSQLDSKQKDDPHLFRARSPTIKL
jgi:signal transduction histidine kinase